MVCWHFVFTSQKTGKDQYASFCATEIHHEFN